MDFCEASAGRQFEDIGSTRFNAGGFTRFCTSIFLLWVYFRNKKNAANHHNYYARALLLPSYFKYILAFMCNNAIFGFLSMVLDRTERFKVLLALEIGIYHMFAEGLAFFFMQYGAGQYAMRKSFFLAFSWGLITAVIFYHIFINFDRDRLFRAQLFFSAHIGAVVVFYAITVMAPISIVYRRPALKVYALYQIVENTTWLLVSTLLYFDIQFGYCVQLVTMVAMQGLLQSIFIYYALAEDSNYWQGIGTSSPLAGMWQIAVDTAEGISGGLSCLSSTTKSLPLIHFGSITLHQQVGFVAGGTSRVYFGTWGRKEVALKLLFAMELTPDVVGDFYTEVQILSTLQHRNVVTCLGISVMPPSLSLVMEHCTNGSLFDYLYKCKQDKRQQSTAASSIAGGVNRIRSLLHEIRTRFAGMPLRRNNSNSVKTSLSVVKSPMDMSERTSEISLTDSAVVGSGRSSLYRRDKKAGPSIIGDGDIDNDSVDDTFEDVEAHISQPRSSITSLQSVTSSQGEKDVRESFRASLTQGQERRNKGLSMNQRMREKLTMKNLATHTEATSTAAHPSSVNDSTPTGLRVWGAEEKPSFPFKEKLRMMHDVVSGILFLHNQGYMPCDIKSPNFLVANDHTVKVADLGESRELYSSCEAEELPNPALNWAPPELLAPVLEDRRYTIESDVYGVAMVLSEILLQVVPLDNANVKLSEKAVYEKIVTENCRPVMPSTIPEAIVSILTKAWSTNPADRVSCEELLTEIEKQKR